MVPGQVAAVEPGHLHARVQAGHGIKPGVVPDVQHLSCLNPRRLRSGMKNAWIRLCATERVGAESRTKKMTQPDPTHVCVAVRDRDQGKALAQENQGRQGILKQVYALAFCKKHLKTGLRQRGIIAGALQHQANRLAPHGTHVMREVGATVVQRIAHFAQSAWRCRQRRGGGRVSHQPGMQCPLGALYPIKTWTAPNPHACMKEGDTPSWFFFLPLGGNDPADPTKPGWGGQFARDPDGWSRDLPARPDFDPRTTVSRWRPDFQRDFAQRMAWCLPP